MHELGVVFHIMDSLEKVATENQVTDITKVVLELGEVSTVLEDYLQSCWKWAIRKRELFARAELVVEKHPYPTVEYGKICPYCKSPDTWLLQGNEFNIKEIEVH